MRGFITYHLLLLGKFCASNKVAVGLAAVATAALPLFSYWFAASASAGVLGLAVSRADLLVASLSADQQAPVSWDIAPAVALALASLLLRRFSSDNYVLRWRSLRLFRAGEALDALLLTGASGLVLFLGALALSAALGLGTSNFTDVHSLFSLALGQTPSQEPDQLLFLATMAAYAFLALALMGQVFLLLRKALRSEAASIALIFVVGVFHLYDTKYVLALFNLPMSLMSQLPNPLSLVYSSGQVGYASWLAPASHGLPAMLAVLVVLFALNAALPARRGSSLR